MFALLNKKFKGKSTTIKMSYFDSTLCKRIEQKIEINSENVVNDDILHRLCAKEIVNELESDLLDKNGNSDIFMAEKKDKT